MVILGIETSCDETGAAILEGNSKGKLKILSNVVASSISLHQKFGGVIPEVAAREQIKVIIPVVEKTLAETETKFDKIDAIAVTVGPGLIGSLLVGVETAKTLAYVLKRPIVPINHLHGHIYANFLTQNSNKIHFPFICLIVSGGHTDLVLVKNHGNYKWLGGTRDDAAGEAFDKVARLLGLSYPGGPQIEKLSKKGNPKKYPLPRPMINGPDFDFSFSGLKTAVVNLVNTLGTKPLAQNQIEDLAASFQAAIVDVLVAKTVKAAKKYQVKQILLGGGVAANSKLKNQMAEVAKKLGIKIDSPPIKYCIDNGAMIGVAAYFNFKPLPIFKICANPGLHF